MCPRKLLYDKMYPKLINFPNPHYTLKSVYFYDNCSKSFSLYEYECILFVLVGGVVSFGIFDIDISSRCG